MSVENVELMRRFVEAWNTRDVEAIIDCSDPDVEDPQFGGAPTNHFDNTWYFDTQVSWDSPWNARITGGVRNLFDEDPPVSFSNFANSFDPNYDVPGRFWYVQYNQKF